MATENAPLSMDKTVAEKRSERPHWVLDDAVYSISALLLSVIIIHSIWTLIIRPRAEAVLSQRVTVTNSSNVKQQVLQLRSVYVILKDHEQELCVILMYVVAAAARAARRRTPASSRQLLDREYVKIGDGQVVLPEDARVYSRPLESLPREEQSRFLPRLLMVAYNRFGATRSVQDAAEAVRDECDFEVASMDTKLSMVRFTAWAIPAVGFVGTVRGIGAALAGSARRHGWRHLRRHHGPRRHLQRDARPRSCAASSSCSGCTSCSSSRIAWCSTAAPTSTASCCANCASSTNSARCAHSSGSAARICAPRTTRRCARPLRAPSNKGGEVIPVFVLDEHFFRPAAARKHSVPHPVPARVDRLARRRTSNTWDRSSSWSRAAASSRSRNSRSAGRWTASWPRAGSRRSAASATARSPKRSHVPLAVVRHGDTPPAGHPAHRRRRTVLGVHGVRARLRA